MITARRTWLCEGGALAVLVVLGPPLGALHVNLLRQELHLGCSLGDDDSSDAIAAEWACGDGLSYLLPGLSYLGALGVLLFSAALAVAVRGAGEAGRHLLRAVLWVQVLALAVLVLPTALHTLSTLSTFPGRGPAAAPLALIPPVLAAAGATAVTAALAAAHLRHRDTHPRRWLVPLGWTLAALATLATVPVLAGGAPAAMVAVWVLGVLAALSTRARWQRWRPSPHWPATLSTQHLAGGGDGGGGGNSGSGDTGGAAHG
ncbi:hypothetical protein [Kineococcus sp. SYSU DK005]|uniref:hypothetical protein n=1 Tax=Kineococcus sp. SYSU DK005 TaxID=3383126 RepID=UPI003D7E8535